MPNTLLKTSSGDMYFDAVFKVDHSANVMVTEHPVQVGAAIADHAFVEPEEVALEIGVSDVSGDGLSVQTYQKLREIMAVREPVTLVTRLHSYTDMVMTVLSVPDDYTTMHALKASLVFKQVRLVSVATTQVQDTVSSSKTPVSTSSPAQTKSKSAAEQPKQKETVKKVPVVKFATTTVTVPEDTHEKVKKSSGLLPKIKSAEAMYRVLN